MKTRNFVMALCLTFAFGTAFAGDPPPPKKERICSLGWYKNNGRDTWFDTCVEATNQRFCEGLEAQMYTRGAHAGDAKNAAADYIVANYVGFGRETCDAALD